MINRRQFFSTAARAFTLGAFPAAAAAMGQAPAQLAEPVVWTYTPNGTTSDADARRIKAQIGQLYRGDLIAMRSTITYRGVVVRGIGQEE